MIYLNIRYFDIFLKSNLSEIKEEAICSKKLKSEILFNQDF